MGDVAYYAVEKKSDTPKLASAPKMEGVRSDTCISKNDFRTYTDPKSLKFRKLIEYLWICYLQKFQAFWIINNRVDLRANESKILMYHFFFHPRVAI